MESNQLVTKWLQNVKSSSKDDSNINLYTHLSRLLTQLQPFSKDKISPLHNLQYISQYFKKYSLKYKAPLNEQELIQFLNKQNCLPFWVHREKELISNKNKQTNDKNVQNFQINSQKLFSKVGVGFGKQQSLRIYSALKQLANKHKTKRLRFWGKILTKNGDYLIAEGITKHSNSGEASTGMQKLGQGANYNTYWVSNSSLSEYWIELPLVSPEQIRISKLIKYVFTGELQSYVQSSPPFPGQERHLLKAQIVRITHNCQIAPKGLYSPLQQNPDQIDYSEEFKMPDFAELSNLQNWVHFNPYLLKMGRSSYYVNPSLTQEQKEQALAKMAENDPKIERLKAINEDKGLQKFGLEGCWTIRIHGSNQLFNNIGKQQGTTSCYAVVSLKNPHWPGWITVSSGKQFGSIYIGFGLKFSQLSFYPVAPQDISLQGQQCDQVYEPNPKDPPDELQPDSDDENKKVEE